jgi:hypothetical protein
MEDDVLFSETQRFKQWWLWVLLIGINGMLLFGVVKQVILGQPFGTKPGTDAELLIIFGLMLLFTLLFFNFRLETRIKKDGIYYRFIPFHGAYRFTSWDNLLLCYVRQYSPIMEYGGWGLRLGMYGKGTAFNVSGNMGLQLKLSNHKKILLGTQRAGEITALLRKIGQWKE